MRISDQVDRSGWMVSASRFIPGRPARPDLARFCPIRKGGSTRPCHRGGPVIGRAGFSARIAFDPPLHELGTAIKSALLPFSRVINQSLRVSMAVFHHIWQIPQVEHKTSQP